MALSRHPTYTEECPLLGAKGTMTSLMQQRHGTERVELEPRHVAYDRKEEAPPDGGHWAGLRGSNGGGTYVMGEGSAPSQP